MIRAVAAGVALASAGVAAGVSYPAQGSAVIGGQSVQLRYAAAFQRETPDGTSGGYAIVLAAKPIRCNQISHLPDQNKLGSRWALISFYATKDGSPLIGQVRGEIDYPVEDAYAAFARGVTINLTSSGPFAGTIWRGRAVQARRKVEGKVYALNVRFAARWCA